ncbi:hypothetical protein MTO96_018964 [Rhipicephalus appendiculatus]
MEQAQKQQKDTHPVPGCQPADEKKIWRTLRQNRPLALLGRPLLSPPCPSGGSLAPVDVSSAENGRGTVGERSVCELQVVPAKEFKSGDNVYTMVHSPRGVCIIINNYNFGDSKREGSQHDVRRMKALFKALHFKCIVHQDLTASKMKETLQEAAKLKEHKVADCLVIILMSHGGQDIIYGVDLEKVHLEDEVFSLFDHESCPALRGKPKLFFIQACRETEHSARMRMTGCQADAILTVPGVTMPSSPREERIATWSDIYVAYATMPGGLAFNVEGIGSWFLSSVYNIFCEHAGTMDLDMLMQLVRKDVMARIAPDGSKQMPSNETYRWKKEFYFNPGFTARASESIIPCCVIHCLCTLFKRCQCLDDEPVDNEPW